MLEVNRLYRIIGRDEQAHAGRRQTTALLGLAFVLLLGVLLFIRRYL